MDPRAAVRDSSGFEVLYVSLELSSSKWVLHFGVEPGGKARRRQVSAGDLCSLEREIVVAGERLGLKASGRVVSCYEAGRDGFWLHRYLVASGVDNRVVDAGSIERRVRRRRVKTDRLDGEKLLALLMRQELTGEKPWSVVRVPSEESEDGRHLHRERQVLLGEIRSHGNRISSLLVTHGIRLKVRRDFLARLAEVRRWDGSRLPEPLVTRLVREWERLQLVKAQLKALEAERRQLLRESRSRAVEQARRLMQLRGIGIEGGWMLPAELYAWRGLRNRRELAALVGLTPTPYQSGESRLEQGIDKAGMARVRTLAIELAWSWLRHQPDSELARWYERRFAHGGSRTRRIGIVALARKLLIALWRYVEYGIVPEGARLKVGAALEA